MSIFEIKMPKLGESITEGTITSWSAKVGDTIKEDDILLEVNTAKVSAEIPSPVSGKSSRYFSRPETSSPSARLLLPSIQTETAQITQPKLHPLKNRNIRSRTNGHHYGSSGKYSGNSTGRQIRNRKMVFPHCTSNRPRSQNLK